MGAQAAVGQAAIAAEARSRRRPLHSAAAPAKAAAARRLAWPVTLLLVCLFVPWIIQIGSLTLAPYRIVLIVMLPPCFMLWLGGRAGPVAIPDVALLVFCIWANISLIILHGAAFALQPGGMLFVETMGGYLMARCFIRDEQDFENMVRLLFRIVAVLLPFALIEATTGRNLSRELFALVLPTYADYYMEPRWGLRRVQSVLDHPILFGVCTGAILAPVHLVLGHGKSRGRRLLQDGVVALTSFLSLSSGAVSAVAAQALLLAWDWLLKRNPVRWKILWITAAGLYLAVSLLSSQSVPEFYLTHFSFDQYSAYFRILIWKFGSASALAHPFLGVASDNWARPAWLPPSIDMMWLFWAVWYGIPAGFLMMAAFFASALRASRGRPADDARTRCRTAYLITMTGFFLVGWTVHFWNATYVLFVFFMGSGAWLAAPSAKGRGRAAGLRERLHRRRGAAA